VAAVITIIGTFASASDRRRGGETASGQPASTLILSCTTISCAIRLVVSGARPVSSLDDQLDLAADDGVAVLRHVGRTAAIDLPVRANGPVSGGIKPILNGSAASAVPASAANAAAATMPWSARRQVRCGLSSSPP
jgi:hypothetical protein